MGTKEEDIKGLMEKFGGDEDIYKRETPQHTVSLPDYYIARYPVTVAQFKAFVEDKKDYKLASERSLWGISNHPVNYVAWYDAKAYCEWLTDKLKATAPDELKKTRKADAKRFWQNFVDDAAFVSLPSEAEWEKAARGRSTKDPLFPWGRNKIKKDYANYDETNINTTSTVGMFPLGKTPGTGLCDLSGNVWEWTRSLWGKDWQKPDYVYPYEVNEEREKTDAGDDVVRVLRGGSCPNDARRVRCAFRDSGGPDPRYVDIGFRLVVRGLSPISP